MLVMFSQGYPRIAGYHDVSVVTRAGPGDPRHERDLPIEDYHQWIWAHGAVHSIIPENRPRARKSSLTHRSVISSLTYFDLLFHPLTMALVLYFLKVVSLPEGSRRMNKHSLLA